MKFVGPLVIAVLVALGLRFLPKKKPGAHYTKFGTRIGSTEWFIGVIVALALIVSVIKPVALG